MHSPLNGKFTSVKVVIGVVVSVAALSSAATLWFAAQSSTPAQVETARGETAEVSAELTVVRLAIAALGDSLKKAYEVQEFMFCTAVPANKRSEMRAFRIDCSNYDERGLSP